MSLFRHEWLPELIVKWKDATTPTRKAKLIVLTWWSRFLQHLFL
jgi:hypothetical protein